MHAKKMIENFMHPLHHYYAIREEENIDHALKLIAKAAATGKMPHLIVTGKDPDANKIVTGFVSSRDIVFGIADHFLKGARKVGPMVWEGLLENEAPKAVSRPVSEIMAPVSVCISGSQDILEAIFLLNKHGASLLPVVRYREVIGVIHMDDILNRLIQMLPP